MDPEKQEMLELFALVWEQFKGKRREQQQTQNTDVVAAVATSPPLLQEGTEDCGDDSDTYTAEEYLSSDRRFSKAKSRFRVCHFQKYANLINSSHAVGARQQKFTEEHRHMFFYLFKACH